MCIADTRRVWGPLTDAVLSIAVPQRTGSYAVVRPILCIRSQAEDAKESEFDNFHVNWNRSDSLAYDS
jgi:hypothetical protein